MESYQIGKEMVLMAALRAGFELADVAEYSPDDRLAADFPRSARYVA